MNLNVFRTSKAAKILAATAAVPAGLLGAFTVVSHAVWHRSNFSTMTEIALRMAGKKHRLEDAVTFDNYLLKRADANETTYQLSSIFSPHVSVTDEETAGMQTFYLNRRGINDRAVIYLHGGCLVSRPSVETWRFVDTIAKRTRAEVIVPMYPLAPVHSFEEAYEAIGKLWDIVVEKYGAENITLMGDTTGAGIATGFAMSLVAAGREQPGKLVLISPCMDLTFKNPDIRGIEAVDPISAVSGLQKAAKLWARGTDLTDYRLSPVNGEVRGLKRIAMYCGTRDIFFPDAKLFFERVHAVGVRSKMQVGHGLNNCYPFYPTPEANRAIDSIVKIVVED